MKYEQYKEISATGDILFFEAHTFKQKIVTFVTGGKYSHCGIAVKVTDNFGNKRLMVLESVMGGVRLVNMSSLVTRNISVLRINAFKDAWSSIASTAMNQPGAVHYNLKDFVQIGFKDLMSRFGVAVKMRDDPAGMVCSEFTGYLLKLAKILYRTDTYVGPSKLFSELLTLSSLQFEIQP